MPAAERFHLMSDPLDVLTVRSFVDVARVMGLKTVAEFVESAEVMNRLRELGVDFAQGYHLHKPACLGTLCHPDPVPVLPPMVASK
jgi:diguanylate cyclase